jgi:hypothetical protein
MFCSVFFNLIVFILFFSVLVYVVDKVLLVNSCFHLDLIPNLDI